MNFLVVVRGKVTKSSKPAVVVNYTETNTWCGVGGHGREHGSSALGREPVGVSAKAWVWARAGVSKA